MASMKEATYHFDGLLIYTGQSSLYCAARQGHVEIVVLLITSGANVNYQIKSHGGTALHGTILCFKPSVLI